MIRIISTFTIALVLFQSVIGIDCIKIEPQYGENGYLYVRDHTDNTKKLFQFKVKIKEQTIRKENGDLTFDIRLKNIEKTSEDINPNLVEFETDSQKITVVKNAGQINKTDNIKIVIPNNTLRNLPFEYSTTQVRVKINNMDYSIDPLSFKITPMLSIDIPVNECKAELGKIIYANGMIKSSKVHTFQVNYNCLTQAKLHVSSEHNFRMKHKKCDEYIPYELKIAGELITQECDINVTADCNSFTNRIMGKCKVKTPAPRIPLAGKYKDIVTFTISAL